MEEVKACGMCVNSLIEPELDSDCDLSYFSIGICAKPYRMLLRSGASRPTEILVERHFGSDGWIPIGSYEPKYCPNCGRELVENIYLSSM